MSGTTWTKFYWSDWESDPALRLCTFAAQGLWMRMLCIASAHDPIGYVAVAGRALNSSALARVTGGLEAEVQILLDELDRNGVFSRDRTGRIYSRRMVRDAKKTAIARKNGNKGGNPSLRNTTENRPSDNQQLKPEVKPQEPDTTIPEEVVVVVGRPLGVHGKAPPEDDWPRASLPEWRDQLALVAGPGLADPTKEGSLTTSMGEIHRWRVAGCSWAFDVLPVVQGKTAQPSRSPIRSWTLFTERILAARDRRLAELPAPDLTNPPPSRRHGTDRSTQPTSRQINIAAAQSGFELAAQHGRRTLGSG